ncbi:hypothetical protein [Trebonia sp.]|uniref:hypothetical protein n=1 Tax=Trebonia sp. TaxID=2767075 RepID=UPI002604F1FF|nr:hypothetical protein [Trebonia sp.]
MKLTGIALAVAVIGLAACSAHASGPDVLREGPAAASAGRHSAAATAQPAAPAITKTVIRYRTVPASSAPATAAPTAVAAPQPTPVPNVTDPWAVVAAYYGDIESGDYPEAWALLSSGAVTGQTYQQFVAGFACTGGQDLSENWQSGDEVSFDLAATDDCTGTVQYFTGVDTVVGGKIVAADVTQAD